MPRESVNDLIVTPRLRESVEQGLKTVEIRLQTDRNRCLIQRILKWKKDDVIKMQFGTDHLNPVHVRVTKSTEQKIISKITIDELMAIVGNLQINTVQELVEELSRMYQMRITLDTTAYFIHFRKID